MSRWSRTIRVCVLFMGITTLYFVLNGIGWAAVIFWKWGLIATVVDAILCVMAPVTMITVVPGSPADSPYYFVPGMLAGFLIWALIVDQIWRAVSNRRSK